MRKKTSFPRTSEGDRPASREFERERYSFIASRSRQGWGVGYYNAPKSLKAKSGVWFAVAKSVALACCKIWCLIKELDSFEISASLIVDNDEVKLLISTEILSNDDSSLLDTAPN